ncbi:hypothetical protein KXD40_008532 [Peronospora effusa]|nr:hypothetical protein KXD40_008532 [Peronospora effusa]
MVSAKKGLLDNVLFKQDAVINEYGQPISRKSLAWRTAVTKVQATIAKSVSHNYQAIIRDEMSARGAREVLEGYSSSAGDPFYEQRQLVVLLGILSRGYHAMIKIDDNYARVTMLQAAEIVAELRM